MTSLAVLSRSVALACQAEQPTTHNALPTNAWLRHKTLLTVPSDSCTFQAEALLLHLQQKNHDQAVSLTINNCTLHATVLVHAMHIHMW